MIIGVPKEIKNHEYRVGLTPESCAELAAQGHSILVQAGAGAGIGASDQDYLAHGSTIAKDAPEVYGRSEMIVKVKEPQASERAMLRPGQILYAYLHLAPDMAQTKDLLASGAICIAYETITGAQGGLPLLAPMSEVAGRMSIQAGASHLEKSKGGSGILLGGVPGVPGAQVAILGAGVVGSHALAIAVGMGSRPTILDTNMERLRSLDAAYGNRIQTLRSSPGAIEQAILAADLVIGGVLIPGASAPKLVTASMVSRMRKGSVLVDVAIDQGGCFETSKATTHADPTYMVDGVVHYCVANMPGAVPRTSTYALNNATIGHALALASKGWRQACQDDRHLRAGLNVAQSKVLHPAVGAALGLAFEDTESFLA